MTTNATPPLIILGMDAGDPRFIQQWMQEGYLPTIASIVEQGCWGTTAGPEHISELGTGISLFSGVSRSEHGYYDFRQLEPGTYDLVLFTPKRAKALPFWAQLRGENKKVVIIDAFEALPVPDLSGMQLSYWTAHQPAFPSLPAIAEPPEILTGIRQRFGPQYRMEDYKRDSTIEEDRRDYHRLLKAIERKGALCRHLLSQGPFDLSVVMFSEMHAAAHRFWRYRPEARGANANHSDPVLTHAIRNIYQAIDRQFGTLLTMLPQEADVFFISMFGMEDYYPTTGLIEDFCRKLSYQVTPESGGVPYHPLALGRQFIPESWRTAISRRLSADMQHNLMADQFRNGTDFKRTTAFAIPSLYDSYIRVNLRGREPQGIVEPGAEYTALLDCLEADLKQLVDPQTGAPAVQEVKRCIDLFNCDVPGVLPDLFVRWTPSTHFLHRVIHPKAEVVQQEPHWLRDSYHSYKGFLAANGPSIHARGAIGNLSLLDLAPTFLFLMNEPSPRSMCGKKIESII